MTTAALSPYEIERNKPMPSLNHGIIQANLILHFAPFIQKYRIISELSLDLSHWPSVPDLCIYPKMEIDLQNDVTAMTEPPLCTIEIISPSQSINELTTKARDYFKHGVKSCWIVIPPLGNIYVFSSPEEYKIFLKTETLTDPILDISFPVKGVFE